VGTSRHGPVSAQNADAGETITHLAKRDTARTMSRENVELARRHLDAWNRGDVDTWVELFHPEGEYISELIGRLEGAENVFRGGRESVDSGTSGIRCGT
jgi:SnoaL-like domain